MQCAGMYTNNNNKKKRATAAANRLEPLSQTISHLHFRDDKAKHDLNSFSRTEKRESRTRGRVSGSAGVHVTGPSTEDNTATISKLRVQLYQRVKAGGLYHPSNSSTPTRSTHTTSTTLTSQTGTHTTTHTAVVEGSSVTTRTKLVESRRSIAGSTSASSLGSDSTTQAGRRRSLGQQCSKENKNTHMVSHVHGRGSAHVPCTGRARRAHPTHDSTLSRDSYIEGGHDPRRNKSAQESSPLPRSTLGCGQVDGLTHTSHTARSSSNSNSNSNTNIMTRTRAGQAAQPMRSRRDKVTTLSSSVVSSVTEQPTGTERERERSRGGGGDVLYTNRSIVMSKALSSSSSAAAAAVKEVNARTRRGGGVTVVDAKHRGQDTQSGRGGARGRGRGRIGTAEATHSRAHATNSATSSKARTKKAAPTSLGAPHVANTIAQSDTQQRRRALLPLVPHDMDRAYYRDGRRWNRHVHPHVLELLSGAALEPPLTSALWTQVYADSQQMHSVSTMQSDAAETKVEEDTVKEQESRPMGHVGAAEQGLKTEGEAAAATTRTKRYTASAADSLPHVHTVPRHVYERKLEDGFYACIRCGNPICAPPWQVPSSVRGIAMFQRMHSDELSVQISTAPPSYAALSLAGGVHARGSSECEEPTCTMDEAPGYDAWGGGRGGESMRLAALAPSDSRAEWMTGIHFVARCACCDGCMGIVSCAIPQAMQAHVQSGQILLLNSACVVYRPFDTRANLAGVVVDASEEDSDDAELSLNGGMDSCRADLALFDENDSIVSSVCSSPSVSSAGEEDEDDEGRDGDGFSMTM